MMLQTRIPRHTGDAEHPERWLNVKQAAAFLHLSPSTVYAMIASGEIPAAQRRPRCAIRIRESTLRMLIRERRRC